MPDERDDPPDPERYPRPWTPSPAVKWLIVAAYTAGVAALMWWALVKEVH